jgi:SAM-dependent methyltransferase
MSQKVLEEHFEYLSDPNRIAAYRAAISKVVRTGDIVLDVGCGTGVLAAMCLDVGAAHSYAVDSSSAIELARNSFVRGGLNQRATFKKISSYSFAPEKKADIVVCDHVGYFGFDYDLINVLGDARRRCLRNGGRVLPQRLRVHISTVESTAAFAQASAWDDERVPERFRWIRSLGIQCKYPRNFTTQELISQPCHLADLDLTVDQPDYFSWHAEFVVSRYATLHGLVGWFECELADDVWMTNSPFASTQVDLAARPATYPIARPQAFLPIERETKVHQGETVMVDLRVRPNEHVISWDIVLPEQSTSFNQSTWKSELFGEQKLRQSLPNYVPTPSEEALKRRLVSSYIDGKRSVEEIRATILREHAAQFVTPQDLDVTLRAAIAESER